MNFSARLYRGVLQFEVEQKAAADACEDVRTHQALHVAEGQAAEQFPREDEGADSDAENFEASNGCV